MKKIALIFLALVLLFSISAVSAESITIDGINFNIPDGYKPLNDVDSHGIVVLSLPIDYMDSYSLNNLETYSNGENIIGMIVVPSEGLTLDDVVREVNNDTEKTISGKTGLFGESAIVNEDGTSTDFVIFKYFEDGKFVLIIGPDEATIEQVVS